MKLEEPKLVEVALRQLAEAELYLSDYLKSPLQYEKIVDQKQQFIELEKHYGRRIPQPRRSFPARFRTSSPKIPRLSAVELTTTESLSAHIWIMLSQN